MTVMHVACASLMAALLLSAPPQVARELVDLRRIGHVSKGRVQDQQLRVVASLIAAGPAAVRFLVSKLGDGRRIPGYGTVIDFWPSVDVGHVALFVICDLFTRADGTTPTVPDLSWDKILQGNRDLPAWTQYDQFVAKHGRAQIRVTVERLLAPFRNSLVWDDAERCFRPQQ